MMQLDLASFASIRSLAEEICTTMQQLDLLILNAGIFALPYCTRTLDGLEMQIGVNHVGHHYLTKLLLPVLKKVTLAVHIIMATLLYAVFLTSALQLHTNIAFAHLPLCP